MGSIELVCLNSRSIKKMY